MNRRSFLRLLGGVLPVAAAAPTYFFAPIGGWHSDVIVNPYYSDKDFLEEINPLTRLYIVPQLEDNLFNPTPLLCARRGLKLKFEAWEA